MEHNQIVSAIKTIRPNAEFVLEGDELNWLDTEQTQPTNAEIEAGWLLYLDKVEQAKAEAEAKREAALAKLAVLGLDADDLKAIGLSPIF